MKVRTKVLIEIIFDGYDISEIRDKYATFELGKLEDEKKRKVIEDYDYIKLFDAVVVNEDGSIGENVEIQEEKMYLFKITLKGVSAT